MNPAFVFPQVYYQYPHWVIPTQRVGADYSSSQAILDLIPDDGLEGVQRAFLAGEVVQQVGIMPLPVRFSLELSVAVCQSLSQCGSLKKRPQPPGQVGSQAEPSQGEISLESAVVRVS